MITFVCTFHGVSEEQLPKAPFETFCETPEEAAKRCVADRYNQNGQLVSCLVAVAWKGSPDSKKFFFVEPVTTYLTQELEQSGDGFLPMNRGDQ